MSNKLQMAAAEREALAQQLQGFEQSAQPSAEDVSEPSHVGLLTPPPGDKSGDRDSNSCVTK